MKKHIEEYVAIWNSKGVSELDWLFEDKSNYWDPNQHGPAIEVLRGALSSTHEAFPDVMLEVVSLDEVNDHQFFLEWRMTGTNSGEFFGNPPTGKRIELVGLDSIKMEAGKITEIRSYYDINMIAQQMSPA